MRVVRSVSVLWALLMAGCAATQGLCARSEIACTDPVSESSRRIVVEPLQVAVLSVRAPDQGLREVVTFGSEAFGATNLYLRFPADWKTQGPIERAFVVLQPAAAVAADAYEILIEAWRVRESWQSDDLHWAVRPKLLGPRSKALVHPSPPTPLYVDVTELVQKLSRTQSDNGIALVSTSTGAHGASYATGATGGLPRLEIYLRTK